jgi:hypothetical protein
MLNVGGTVTYSVQTFSPGNAISNQEPTNFARVVVASQSTSGQYAVLDQPIEDVRSLAGQTVSVSFWAKADTTRSVAVELYQNFGSGGSSSVSAPIGKVDVTSSWSRYTLVANIPSISGKTIGTSSNVEVFLWCSGGSDFNSRSSSLGVQNGTFDFWGVQVEANNSPTPFERRPIGVELALCQRYCYRVDIPQNNYLIAVSYFGGSGCAVAVNNYWRATPTVTFSTTSNWVYYDNPNADSAATTFSSAVDKNLSYFGVITDGQQSGILFRNTAAAVIVLFTAEL